MQTDSKQKPQTNMTNAVKLTDLSTDFDLQRVNGKISLRGDLIKGINLYDNRLEITTIEDEVGAINLPIPLPLSIASSNHASLQIANNALSLNAVCLMNSMFVDAFGQTLFTGVSTDYPCAAVVTSDFTALSSTTTLTQSTFDSNVSAQLLGSDWITQGNWIGVYGGAGIHVPNHNDSFTCFSPYQEALSIWDWSSSVVNGLPLQALQSAFPPYTRQWLPCYYSLNDSFEIRLNLPTASFSKLTLYFAGIDVGIRKQLVDVFAFYDAGRTQSLASCGIQNFSNGCYVSFRVKGSIAVRIKKNDTEGTRPMLTAMFLDHIV